MFKIEQRTTYIVMLFVSIEGHVNCLVCDKDAINEIVFIWVS